MGGKPITDKHLYMLIGPQVLFMNSIMFSQYRLSPVSVLMLMDHLSSARSLISSPYLPHHFIWPKGNNKSLIHYPLTEAAMRKYLITGNKLNFNHRIFRQRCTLKSTSKYAYITYQALDVFCVRAISFTTVLELTLDFISWFMTNKDLLYQKWRWLLSF